jgi:hypothetical protein
MASSPGCSHPIAIEGKPLQSDDPDGVSDTAFGEQAHSLGERHDLDPDVLVLLGQAMDSAQAAAIHPTTEQGN